LHVYTWFDQPGVRGGGRKRYRKRHRVQWLRVDGYEQRQLITITSGESGSGNGTVHYTVAANSSTNPVTGTLTIAGNTFTVTQTGAGACTFVLSATEASPTAAGGASTVGVTAAKDCAWTAASNDGFITITSGSSGSGNGRSTTTWRPTAAPILLLVR